MVVRKLYSLYKRWRLDFQGIRNMGVFFFFSHHQQQSVGAAFSNVATVDLELHLQGIQYCISQYTKTILFPWNKSTLADTGMVNIPLFYRGWKYIQVVGNGISTINRIEPRKKIGKGYFLIESWLFFWGILISWFMEIIHIELGSFGSPIFPQNPGCSLLIWKQSKNTWLRAYVRDRS